MMCVCPFHFRPAIVASCEKALGLAKRLLPNSAFSASSSYNSTVYHGPYNARLNDPYGWCSQSTSSSEYLSIKFGKVVNVTAVEVQGALVGSQYTSPLSFQLFFTNTTGSAPQWYPVTNLANDGVQVSIVYIVFFMFWPLL